MEKILKLGTLKCPADKTHFYWKQIVGMRVTRVAPDGKGQIYDARCPEC